MNSVTRTARGIDHQKEGIGKEFVVLFCCALFFLLQTLLYFDLFSAPLRHKSYLTISTNESLVIKPLLAFREPSKKKQLALSFEAQQLAPFFFLPIAINYCDKRMLMSVKGIGPSLADKIIQTRSERGSFLNPEDLARVSGIGPVRLRKLTPYFSFIKNNEQY